MVAYKDHVFAADMTGGFSTLRYLGEERGVAGAKACLDRTAPRVSVVRRSLRLTRKGVSLRGRASDRGCRGATSALSRRGALRAVSVAVGRRAGGTRCRFLRTDGRFTAARSCRRPAYTRASGTGTWRFARRARLPRGTYEISVRALDRVGNAGRATRFVRRLR